MVHSSRDSSRLDLVDWVDCDDFGVSRAGLGVLEHSLRQWTAHEPSVMPAASVALARDGHSLGSVLLGRQGPEPDAAPLRPDGIFLLASLTKPLTCLAAMLLVERGQLRLADLVTDYLPEFGSQGKQGTRLVHLLTHTSGLPDQLPDNLALRRAHAPLSEFLRRALTVAPLFPPGTSVSYQSMGTLVLSAIVEQVSGKPLPGFLRENVFGPLGLSSSALGAATLPAERLVRVRQPREQEGTDWGWNSSYWRNLGAPWGGMFSTPQEYLVLCRLFAEGGQVDGVRICSPATVTLMTTNRLRDLPDIPESMARTQPWGLGWRLNHPGMADSFGDLLSDRAFGHWGATGTMAWVDPRSRVSCVILTTAPLDENTSKLVRLSNLVAAAVHDDHGRPR